MKKNISKILFAASFTAIFWFGPQANAADDFQYWSRATLKTGELGPWNLSTYGDLRLMDNASRPKVYLISEKLGYEGFKNLALGINYTYIQSESRRKSGKEVFLYQHRLELEANPHWTVTSWLKIKNRNRMEFRWIETKGSDNTRFRQLWELSFPFKFKKLPVKGFFMNNEYFVDFNRAEINEDRLIPAGLDFKIYKKTSLKVFYMIQFTKGPRDWSSNQILGTHLTLDF